jgi:hypothetical protein
MSVHAPAVLARLRALPVAGQTSPARLLRLGAVLVVACLITSIVSMASAGQRQAALDEATGRVSSLTEVAAKLYHALADADATATSGYVVPGETNTDSATRARYEADIAEASSLLVTASSVLPRDNPAYSIVTIVSGKLPEYTGLVESARVYNRLGLPLGQTYLGSASSLLRQSMLPAVARLRELPDDALIADYRAGGAIPYALALVGLGALLAVIDAARRERVRTHRILNPGLAAASALLVLTLLWWAVAMVLTGFYLSSANRHSEASAALDEARAAVLQARSNEALVLVARSGISASDTGFTAQLDRVLAPGGLLDRAEVRAGSGKDQVSQVRSLTQRWSQAHRRLRELDDGGQYRAAVASSTGTDLLGSGAVFNQVDAAFDRATDAQRTSAREAAHSARASQRGLDDGPATLALLAAISAAGGITIRVLEYR